jgi:hypothetical protein
LRYRPPINVNPLASFAKSRQTVDLVETIYRLQKTTAEQRMVKTGFLDVATRLRVKRRIQQKTESCTAHRIMAEL